MAEASIPVDLLNPGQVFACLGFLEFANELIGKSEATFDWRDRENCRFWLRSPGDKNPFAIATSFLSRAKAHAQKPEDSLNSAMKWGVGEDEVIRGDVFPFPDPPSPATLPTVLEGSLEEDEGPTRRIVLDHWGDDTQRDNVKFWAGAGGYPGAARARDALELIRKHGATTDPFSVSAVQSSSFSFDWRRDYIPLEIGFSLNRHDKIATLGYPFVELLAAYGLTHARPKRLERRNPLDYRYCVIGSGDNRDIGSFYGAPLIRSVLGGTDLPFECRSFRMKLGWPGKEGQARAITTVIEETIS